MPGWSGCDVCDVIEAMRIRFGDLGLPDPSTFDDPKFGALNLLLQAEDNRPLVWRALKVAQGVYVCGMYELALTLSDAVPQLLEVTDSDSAVMLAEAQIVRARVLDTQKRTAEANTAFALAGHLYALAGRTQQ